LIDLRLTPNLTVFQLYRSMNKCYKLRVMVIVVKATFNNISPHIYKKNTDS